MIHETDDEGAASFDDHGIPLLGDGAPWVLEFAVMELCAALGLSTDAGKRQGGCVLEVRYPAHEDLEEKARATADGWHASIHPASARVTTDEPANRSDRAHT